MSNLDTTALIIIYHSLAIVHYAPRLEIGRINLKSNISVCSPKGYQVVCTREGYQTVYTLRLLSCDTVGLSSRVHIKTIRLCTQSYSIVYTLRISSGVHIKAIT